MCTCPRTDHVRSAGQCACVSVMILIDVCWPRRPGRVPAPSRKCRSPGECRNAKPLPCRTPRLMEARLARIDGGAAGFVPVTGIFSRSCKVCDPYCGVCVAIE